MGELFLPPDPFSPTWCFHHARGCAHQSERNHVFQQRSLVLLIAAVVGSANIQAVETTAPVIVTATRTEQAVDRALASVVLIDRQTIEQSQARDAAELLRRHAGIDIARNGGPGQNVSVFIRGAESNQTLVLLDGVKLNPGTIGTAALQNIDPTMIERIEIVKGPRSTLYGSDAIGGVINIITRRPDQARSAQFSATAGSHDTRELTANVGAREGIWRFGADLATQDTDGFPTRTTATQDRGYDNVAYNLNAGAAFGATDIELRRWQSTGTTEYFDFFLAPVDQDYDNSVTALRVEQEVSSLWTTLATLSQMQDDITQNQSADFVRTRRNSLDWQNDLALDMQLLTAGVTLWRESTDALSYGTPYASDTDINEVYLQDDIDLGAQQVLLGVRNTDHEDFGNQLSWNAGYGLDITQRDQLYANAGTAFRAPDADDRFGFIGNPDLDPETSRTLELGLRHRFADTLKGSVSVFDTRIDDLIEPNATFTRMENIEEARIQGIEAGAEYRDTRWDAQVSAILQNPRNETDDEWLARRARRSLTGGIGYRFDRARVGAELVAAGARKDSPYSTVVNGGYGLLNLLAETRLSTDFTLAARLENALDKNYALADTYRTSGRAFFVTLRYTPFGKQ